MNFRLPKRGSTSVLAAAALFSSVGLLLAPATARGVPPGVAAAPAQPARGPVQQTSHAERAPADRSFGQAQTQSPPRTAQDARTAAEGKTRLFNESASRDRAGGNSPRQTKSLVTTVASLAFVLAMFAGAVWIMRRGMPRSLQQRLPSEVVDILGQQTLGHRQHVQLIRLGQKLLLVNVTPNGAETLSEVTDLAEVERLVALCRGTPARSTAPSFREVFQQLRNPPPVAASRPRSPGALSMKSEVSNG